MSRLCQPANADKAVQLGHAWGIVGQHAMLIEAAWRLQGLKCFPLLQIYADGHCGSLRQRDLLSSDATVLALTSLHEMWFTPLLLPW